jgi:AraC-like DNA-binding protein
VLAPKKHARLRWYPGTEQLILRVPYALIREVTSRAADDDPRLAPGFLVPRAHGAQWDLIAQSLLNILSMPSESAVHRNWLDHFERNVALFLLSHQPAIPAAPLALTSGSAPPEPTADALRAGDSRRMGALLAYMDSRLCAPISLEDLARAAGVGVRTLNALCHHHHGVTPMELLRNMRLDGVRRRLQLHPDASITDTALAFGFGHLGRFAHYYHERFHELPRETQARQRGGIEPSGRPGA